MSDLELLRHLEQVIGQKLEEVPEKKFRSPWYAFERGNVYVLSGDGNVIGLYLRDIDRVRFKTSDLYRFKNLVYLYLVNVNLRSFVFLKKLKNLQSLALVSVGLTDMSFTRELTALTSLDLSDNRIMSITGLESLTALTSLDLNSNQITDITGLESLTALTSLHLYNNGITVITGLESLTALTSLDLNSNQITDITGLESLTALTSLDLSRNQITAITGLERLTALTSLDLNGNGITAITGLESLTALTSLDVSGNGITVITGLESLTALTSLDLSYNRIKEVPDWLTEKGLEIRIDDVLAKDCINLYRNPIEKPPLEVVRQGNDAIRNYYQQLEAQGKDYLYEAKMLIVGEGGAGKTTLAHKIEDSDCPLPSMDDRTHGITIQLHRFNVRAKNSEETRPFHLNVWDFGGQEIYHYTHRFFLSKRSLYVLVADNRENSTDFNYWLNIIELFAGESPIIIILNEKDDIRRALNESELRARYPNSIQKILAVNFKTSEENDGQKRGERLRKIDEIIRAIEHHADILPHIGEPVPKLWVKVREAIENDTRNHIYLEEFDKICHEHKITKEWDIDTLLGYFHDLGIVLHFADNPLLRDRVILKPQWATNAIYRLFDNDNIKMKKGRFTRSDCESLWTDEQYRQSRGILIELMKKFQLVYEIEQTGNLVAPQMLPESTPVYPWENNNNSQMQFRYDRFMPRGIFWQFVVIMYSYIENHEWVWRNGAIFHRDGTRAEVIENISDRRIYIRFFGKNIPEFRAIISDGLDRISKAFHRLEYEKMIPCNCSVCEGSSKPHLFKYSTLQKRIESGKKDSIECEISEEDVKVKPLLEGFNLLKSKNPLALDNPMIDRRQLRKTLQGLIPEQFDDLLFDIQPPKGIISPSTAQHSDRVNQLFLWAESPTGCGLSRIQSALYELFPTAKNSEKEPEIAPTVPPKNNETTRPDSPATTIRTIKIFLASSSELRSDRDEFEIFISRETQKYLDRGINLRLVRWENFLDAMSQTRKQDDYNKAVAACDVLVSLFYTKAGKYTEEEFLTAWETFQKTGKPLIFIYFKDAPTKPSEIDKTLQEFKQKVDDLGHFYTTYENIDRLKHHFGEQLIRFLPELTET